MLEASYYIENKTTVIIVGKYPQTVSLHSIFFKWFVLNNLKYLPSSQM